MPKAKPFKWRHYQAEIILLCVRWYLRYSLSYRDLEEMMAKRGLTLDHSTIARWVLAYATFTSGLPVCEEFRRLIAAQICALGSPMSL